jgi:hypothetical protein
VRLIVSSSPWRKRGADRSGFTARSLQGRSTLPQAGRGDIVEVPNYIRLAKIRAVLEIVAGPDGKPPEDVLWNAYRASQSGVIVFALNGVTIASVNKIMDRIVPCFPLNIPGVLYIDAQDRCLLAWVLNRAKLIFWQTNAFQSVARKSMNFSAALSGDCSRLWGIASADVSDHPGRDHLAAKPSEGSTAISPDASSLRPPRFSLGEVR